MTAYDTNGPRDQPRAATSDRYLAGRSREDLPDRTILTLIRAGTRRCRFVAAFMAVAFGLVSQTAGAAYAQARESVLYLDAPSVSSERAERAGEVASEYSRPGSPATGETLAWLAMPNGALELADPPEGAREAFASVTAPNSASGVTTEVALAAGETMLAQLEEAGDGRGGEIAATGAVRPRLGDDGTAAGEEAGATEKDAERQEKLRYEAEDAPPATQPATVGPVAPEYGPSALASAPPGVPPVEGGEAPAEELEGEANGGPDEEPGAEPSGAGLVVALSEPEPQPQAPDAGAGEAVELAYAPLDD